MHSSSLIRFFSHVAANVAAHVDKREVPPKVESIIISLDDLLDEKMGGRSLDRSSEINVKDGDVKG